MKPPDLWGPKEICRFWLGAVVACTVFWFVVGSVVWRLFR